MTSCTWQCRRDLKPGTLQTALGGEFGVERSADADRHCALTFYDCFGSRLWFAGLALHREGETLRLSRLQALVRGEALATVQLSGATPRHWWELPGGELRQLLRPQLKLRALLPVTRIDHRRRDMVIKSSNGKIVVRAQFDSYRDLQTRQSGPAHSPFYQALSLLPLRGYDAEFEAVRARIERGLDLSASDSDPLRACFEYRGELPQPYSARGEVALRPDEPAQRVARRMICAALGVMRQNEQGLIDDVDTEFLHDYRVSVRKIRALLSQLKGVFPERFTGEMKGQFSALGRRTNRLRDLDVYLLERDDYFAMLPEYLQPGLVPMFDAFAAERSGEQRQVARFLGSAAYRGQFERWLAQFDESAQTAEAPRAQTPIGQLACRLIDRRYRRVRRDGRKIGPTSSDDAVHRLRIDCKKLRYGLEFFSPLFHGGDTGALVKRLKRLQDVLGRFNDLSVQQRSLRARVEQMQDDGGPLQVIQYLAVGGLLGLMNREQRALRVRIAAEFKLFDDRQTRHRYKRLFRAPRTEHPEVASEAGEAGTGPAGRE
jgi:CHAD domain-containing protein